MESVISGFKPHRPSHLEVKFIRAVRSSSERYTSVPPTGVGPVPVGLEESVTKLEGVPALAKEVPGV